MCETSSLRGKTHFGIRGLPQDEGCRGVLVLLSRKDAFSCPEWPGVDSRPFGLYACEWPVGILAWRRKELEVGSHHAGKRVCVRRVPLSDCRGSDVDVAYAPHARQEDQVKTPFRRLVLAEGVLKARVSCGDPSSPFRRRTSLGTRIASVTLALIMACSIEGKAEPLNLWRVPQTSTIHQPILTW